MNPQEQNQRQNIFQQLGNFIAPKLMSVGSQIGNTIGMGKDYIDYKTARDEEERRKQIFEYNQKRNKVVESQKEFGFNADQQGNQFDPKQYLKGTAQGAAEAGSIAAPVGKTLLPTIGLGAASGGLSALSKDDADFGDVLTSMIVGGGTAGVLKGTSNVLGGIKNKVTNYLDKGMVQKATEKLTQASPTADRAFIETRGKTLTQALQKYVPAGSGYDDLLGDATARGRGGVLNKLLDDAESMINQTVKAVGNTYKVQGDNIVMALQKEREDLASQIGNTAKIEALDSMIKAAQNKYAKGVDLASALKTLRAANSKFGKSVIEVDTGDAVQSAVQKVEANVIRKTLKGMFPEIASALDTQADILTLQPILNHARSVSNTQGSTIRNNVMNKINITNPIQTLDGIIDSFVVGSPEQASTVLKKGATKQFLPDIVARGADAIGSGMSKVSDALNVGDNLIRGARSTISSASMPQGAPSELPTPATTTTQQGTGTKPQTETVATTTTKEYVPINEFGATVDELGKLYTMALMSGDAKAADQIKALYDFEKENYDSFSEGVTDTKPMQAVNSLKGLYENVQKQGITAQNSGLGRLGGVSGTISSITQSSPEAAAYDNLRSAFMSQISRGLGEKGVLTDQDVERASKAFPTFYDTPETASIKWQQLEGIISEISAKDKLTGDALIGILEQAGATSTLPPIK